MTSAKPERVDLSPVLARQVLALPQLRDATLVGGRDGLDRPVEDVEVITGAREIESQQRPAAVILDGKTLRTDHYQVDLALRSAHDTGASMFLLCGEGVTAPLAAVRLANKVGMPLVVVPTSSVLELADALRRFVRTPYVLRADVMLAAIAALRAAAMPQRSAVALETITAALRGPSALLGSDGAVIQGDPAAAPADAHDLLEVPITAQDGDIVRVLQPIALAPSERPSFWLVCALDSPSHAWRSAATALLAVAGWYVAAGLAADRLERERDARFRLGVLNSIVGAGDKPEPALVNQLGLLGWHVDGWCTAVHVQVSGGLDPHHILTLSDELQRQLAGKGIHGAVAERPDGWSIWTVERHEPQPASYSAFTEAVRSTLAGFGKPGSGLVLHAGVGRPYLGLIGLRTSLAEAKQASLIAQAAGGSGVVQHVDDMGIRRILLSWYSSDGFADFAHTLLAPLLGQTNGAELIRTLEAYLDCQSSATDTAARLGVHRNTVLHRVERLRQLLSVDFDDPDERLAAQLACRLVRLET
jgi:hypothetical protein